MGINSNKLTKRRNGNSQQLVSHADDTPIINTPIPTPTSNQNEFKT
jgi:hypothetical protein